jgi:hypothetical protein
MSMSQRHRTNPSTQRSGRRASIAVRRHFQLVAFHPHFVFGGEDESDAGNFVNRSPFPALHLLRQADVTAALDAHPNGLEVPEANHRRLLEVGTPTLRQLVGAAIRDGEEGADAEPG